MLEDNFLGLVNPYCLPFLFDLGKAYVGIEDCKAKEELELKIARR